MAFALFFLAEYANMILIATLTSDHVPWRLAVAGVFPARWLPSGWGEDCFLPVLLPVAARNLSALPLRPDHASGLEGVRPAVTMVWLVFIGGWMMSPLSIWK
jgi:NADH-quinone oxidoreductase subunit H